MESPSPPLPVQVRAPVDCHDTVNGCPTGTLSGLSASISVGGGGGSTVSVSGADLTARSTVPNGVQRSAIE
jgi:hypothetical protein